MSEFRFILGKRALIVFLAFLVATGALLGTPAASRTLAESPPPVVQEASAVSADSVAAEAPILDPSGHSPLLQGASGTSTWTMLTLTNSPSARYGHAMAATPSGVLLFGGRDSGGTFRNDTWLFNASTSTWGLLNTGSASPSARQQHAMAATPSGVLLFGGFNISLFNDTWLFNTSTSTWGPLDTGSASPTKRFLHAMATLPTGDVLLFGGSDGNTFRNDTWLFNASTSTWGLLDTGSASPSARYGHAMAATPSGVLLFGGSDGTTFRNDTWLFNASTSTWGLLDTGSASPSARYGHAMAATPSGDVLLFGGKLGSSSGYADTWLFNTSTDSWTQLSAAPPPPARFGHAMAATPSTATPSGVLLFGGEDVNNAVLKDTWLYGPTESTPTIAVTSPTAGAHWPIGSDRNITWTATDLGGTALAILLARNGVDFTETLTTGLASTVTHYTWMVTGPGTINAKVRVLQDATEGTSPGFFTIADAYPYTGSTITTSDPVLEISGGSGPGTLWVTPLEPALTSDPDLNQFRQATGQRSALFFDIRQENLTGILTIVLHFNHQLGEETFVLYLWNSETGWIPVPGTLNASDHTFTFTIDADLLLGTPFALGGNPTAMPGISPWGLILLSLSLLGLGGWWFLRRRRPA